MYKHILVPVVLDDHHDTQASYLAARALADKEAKFTIIHVLESIPNYAMAEIPKEVFAKTREGVERELKQSAKALTGSDARLVAGHAGRTIVDDADANDVDCIVLASHRPGFADMFLGSTASRVVRHAKCAVHVIR